MHQVLCASCQYAAGAQKGHPSDWAALPLQLLIRAFELQSNALDNCAAACVCKSWQAAANGSVIRVLHLHINRCPSVSSRLEQWCAYLATRSSIGELQLTAGDAAKYVCSQNISTSWHRIPLNCLEMPFESQSIALAVTSSFVSFGQLHLHIHCTSFSLGQWGMCTAAFLSSR